ncbi:MAG: VOC family protein [Actinomycetota bacterium]|nr:VOC family protein [Actinomycetota bacterium]
MSSRITALSLAANDPDRVAAFWQAALGWDQVFHDSTGIDLADPRSGLVLEIGRVDSSRAGKDRLHLDLRADGTGFTEELNRLLALGATRSDVGQDADATWEVLADPEGNTFCLLRRTVQEVGLPGPNVGPQPGMNGLQESIGCCS